MGWEAFVLVFFLGGGGADVYVVKGSGGCGGTRPALPAGVLEANQTYPDSAHAYALP